MAHYGDVCSVCGAEGGNDVHHKRYAEILGTEKMSDYQVLCRICHEAHHKAERSRQREGKKKRKSSIHIQSAWKALSPFMKLDLMDKYGFTNDNDLYIALIRDQDGKMYKRVAWLLGVGSVYGIKKGIGRGR